jgi:hypothetical protein
MPRRDLECARSQPKTAMLFVIVLNFFEVPKAARDQRPE